MADVEWTVNEAGKRIPKLTIRPAPPQELSDADVFGSPAQAAPIPSLKEMTDAEVFGARPSGPTIADAAKRTLGLTARDLGEGLPSIPLMIGDALNTGINFGIKGVNALRGEDAKPIPYLGLPTRELHDSLTRMGIPEPATPAERISGEMAKSVASIPSMAEYAALSGVKALEPLLTDFGRQATAAMGAGLGQQGSKELGAPWWVQLLAGLGGGFLGGMRPGAGDPVKEARLKAFEESGIEPNAADVSDRKSTRLNSSH